MLPAQLGGLAPTRSIMSIKCSFLHNPFYTWMQTLSNVDFDSLMSEVSSSDILPQHGTVIAMHLLQQSRNLSKLRQHMEHLFKNGIGCLGSHIDKLVSTNVCIF